MTSLHTFADSRYFHLKWSSMHVLVRLNYAIPPSRFPSTWNHVFPQTVCPHCKVLTVGVKACAWSDCSNCLRQDTIFLPVQFVTDDFFEMFLGTIFMTGGLVLGGELEIPRIQEECVRPWGFSPKWPSKKWTCPLKRRIQYGERAQSSYHGP